MAENRATSGAVMANGDLSSPFAFAVSYSSFASAISGFVHGGLLLISSPALGVLKSHGGGCL